MKEKLTLEMNLDEYLDPNFYFMFGENGEECMRLDMEHFDEIIKRTKLPRELLDTMQFFSETIGETLRALKRDMTDLYKEIKAIKETK